MKGFILKVAPRTKVDGHSLAALTKKLKGLASDIEFDPPFKVEALPPYPLLVRDAEAKEKKFHEVLRYPIDTKGKPWLGVRGFYASSCNRMLKRVRADCERLTVSGRRGSVAFRWAAFETKGASMSAEISLGYGHRRHAGRWSGTTTLSLRTAGRSLTLALVILAAPFAAAQPPGKMPRIGVLRPGDTRPSTPVVPQAFRERLRELGYLEGQNIAFEVRHGGGRLEKAPELATELVRLNVDVIVVGSFPFARAVKQATATIPIVSVSADPVGTGLAASLARPGGNLTGFSYMTPELSGKRLELLKETVPGLSRVAILWNPDNLHEPPAVRQLELAARALGVQLQLFAVRAPGELDAAFAAIDRARANALIVFENPLHVRHRSVIAELAMKSRLPTMFEIRSFVEAGGLIAYGPRLVDMWRLAATYVDRILKGAKPADLPIEQPTKFELVINLKTARALGLTIPASLLLRANDVIE